MSGPKSYTPPPQYSKHVFDGKLNEIFQLQCTAQLALSQLNKMEVSDVKRNISFNCVEILNLIANDCEKLLKTYRIDHEGSISQELKDKIEAQIDQRIIELHHFVDKLNQEKNEFQNKQDDYESYVHYDEFYDHSVNKFNQLKRDVLSYLEQYLKDNYESILTDANKSINHTQIKSEKALFDFGFLDIADSYQQKLIEEISSSESEINKVRADVSSKVLEMAGDNCNMPAAESMNSEIKNENVTNKIQELDLIINKVTDENRRFQYEGRLKRIKNTEAMKNDIYYYNELIDKVYSTENTIQRKNKVHSMKELLINTEWDSALKMQCGSLESLCDSLIKKSKLRTSDVEEVQDRLTTLQSKDEEIKRATMMKKKERQFLKEQVVRGLTHLDYQVMSDMKVVDFEKESDFILSVPKQNNFVNLKFRDDGSFLYRFLIPENKDTIKDKEVEEKLAEMKTACGGFKNVLTSLKSFGLHLEQKEKTACKEMIMSLTDSERERIPKQKLLKKKKRKVTSEFKKQRLAQ